ncbi:MAG TPA: macro domain-containing protein [Longimicrobiales bacterium]|nr:macro domain-containing protein [Longimicrobiales bacterium]
MIRIVQGELTGAALDAVLRPVSAEWTAVTPAMRRLELAAGEAPAEQCRRLGELPVGSAVITPAGDLPAQFLIHAVVRSIDEPVTGSGVRRALQNGLRRLAEWGIERVAMAPLGTGAGNLDADEAASIMIPVLIEQMQADGSPTEVEIYVDSDYERDVFERHLALHGGRGSGEAIGRTHADSD